MNDKNTIAQNREELIEQRSEFPIEFEAGTPFGVSGRTIIFPNVGKSGRLTTPEVPIADTLSLSDITLTMSRFLDDEIERMLKILEKMPSNTHILNNIGLAYLSKGDLDTAIAYFNKALDFRRDFRPARVSLAKAYTLQGMFDDALAIYAEEESHLPHDSKLLMNKANVYVKQGKTDLAKATFDEVISLNPDNAAAYHNRGIILVTQQKPEKAIADFRRALSLDPRSAATYNALGVCYVIRRNLRQAIKHFNIAHHLDSSDLATLKNLATAYQLADNDRKAIELLEKHLSIYPMDAEARDLVVSSYLRMKEYDRSLSHVQFLRDNVHLLAKDDVDLARMFNNIGVAWSYLHQSKQAIDMYQKSIEICDEDHMAIPYCNKLKLYLQTGKVRRAEFLLDEYIGKEPHDYWPVVLLANHYLDNGDYDKALELGTLALQTGGDTLEALALLNGLYSDAIEDLDKAIEMAERAHKLAPSNVVALNNLAYSYIRKGRFADAKSLLERIPWQQQYFYAYATRGLLRIGQGNVREGIRLYNQAVGMAPSEELKRLVRQKKHVELGRHHASIGNFAEARRQLTRVHSIKTRSPLYEHQAERLLAKI